MRPLYASVLLTALALGILDSAAQAACSATIVGSQTISSGALKQIQFHVIVSDCSDSSGSFDYLLETERADTHEQSSTIRHTSWGPVHGQSDFVFDDAGGGGLNANYEILSVLAQSPVDCICP